MLAVIAFCEKGEIITSPSSEAVTVCVDCVDCKWNWENTSYNTLAIKTILLN